MQGNVAPCRVNPVWPGPGQVLPATGDLDGAVVREDINLALLANEGIRADTPEMRLAASRRFAALTLQSFQAGPVAVPLPPAVRMPPAQA